MEINKRTNQKIRKGIAMFLAIIMIVGNVAWGSLPVHAEGQEDPSVVFSYDVDENGELSITGYKGASVEVVIPSMIDGKKVTQISCFSGPGADHVFRITIEDGVETIGGGAFSNCMSLVSVSIPQSVTTIGDYAFSSNRRLTEVTISEGVQYIGYSAFLECESLAAVTIPKSVITIGASAFCRCANLESLEIQDGVTAIGERAFGDCAKISYVNIPGSISRIPCGAFENCSALEEVVIGEGVSVIEENAFAYCRSINSIEFPDGLTVIQAGAFRMNTISYMVIPASVADASGLELQSSSNRKVIVGISGTIAESLANRYGHNFYDITDHSEKNHLWMNETSILSRPTCTTDGQELCTCFICKEEETRNIPANGSHSWTLLNSIQPTCSEPGKKTYSCSVCGEKKEETIPNPGHAWKTKVDIVNPTCTEDGSKTYTCGTCGEIRQDVIEATGHSWGDAEIDENGMIRKTCSVCEMTEIVGTVPSEYQSLVPDVETEGTNESGNIVYGFVPLTSGTYTFMTVGDKDTKGVLYDSEMHILASDDDGGSGLNYAICANLSAGEQYFISSSMFDKGMVDTIVTVVKKGDFTEADTSEADYGYQITTDGRCEIFSYKGNEAVVKIPEYINGFRVERITTAFSRNENLVSVIIPDGVLEIESTAFMNCSSLMSVRLPSGLRAISNMAFAGCPKLLSITIPQSVITIESNAFGFDAKTLTISGVRNSYAETFVDNYKKDSYAPISMTFKEIEEHTHIWNDGQVVKTPEELIDGEMHYRCSICGEVNVKVLPAEGHNIVDDPEVKATCTEAGKTAGRHCTICGEVFVEQKIVLPTGHQFVEQKGKEASCTEDGLTDGSHCSVCELVVVEQKVIPAKGHSWGIGETKEPATCTTEGLWIQKCENCEEIRERIIPRSGHVYVIDAKVQPTCTEAGKTLGVHCSICDDVLVEQEVIPAKGHTIVEEAAVDASCTEDGKTVGSHCSVCKEVLTEQEIIPMTGHKSVLDPEVEATCTKSGKTAGVHCENCGEILLAQEEIPALGHAWDIGTAEVAATCTTEGRWVQKCENCGEIKEKIIPSTGHRYVVDEKKQVTCTEDGKTIGVHCELCGNALIEQETIPAKGHSIVVEEAVEATCLLAGKTEGSYCSVCKEVLVASEEIPAKPHSYSVDDAVEPTCTVAGKTVGVSCKSCGEVLVASEEIPALGHTEVTDETEKAVTATCTTDGKTEGSHCSVCGEILVKQEVISKNGHSFVVDRKVEPACEEIGLTVGAHCENCEIVLIGQERIPALGHKWDEGIVTLEPTTSAEGIRTYTCSVCKETKTETIAALQSKVTIKEQPADVSAAGGMVTFHVAAEGNGLTYQWYWRKNETSAWGVCGFTGSKTDTVTVEAIAARNGFQYRCEIKDQYGNVVYSEPAALIISAGISITKQPVDMFAASGIVKFTTAAAGDGITYQWKWRKNDSDEWKNYGTASASATSLSIEAIAARNGFQYRCEIKDQYGNIALTESAKLYCSTKAMLIKNPENVIKNSGTAVFSVKAVGEGLSYQWYWRKNETSAWGACGFTGSKTDTMTVDVISARNGFQYRCEIKDAQGNVVYSEPAALIYGSQAVITKQPVNVKATAGNVAVFSLVAAGDGLTYQWYWRKAETNDWSLCGFTGSKSASMQVDAIKARNGFQYQCVIKDKYGNTVKSSIVTFTVE